MGLLRRMLSSVESQAWADRPADALQARVGRALPEGRAARTMRGEWIGHPLHPVLILFPVGSWLSAAVLDLMPHQRTAARRLVLAGLVGAVPAVATGLAEFRDLDRPQRRVGLVHAIANLTASACYAESYRCRRRGRTRTGQIWSVVGLAAIGVGGTLGGHLAYAQGAGVYRWQEPAPQPEGAAEDAEPRQVRVTAGD